MRDLSFADNSLDTILSVLAPRNPQEFSRLLNPNGQLILGVPGPNHLLELRNQLDISTDDFEEKADEAANKCIPYFQETSRENILYQTALKQEQIADLIQMTPMFWNSGAEEKERAQTLKHLQITISFVLINLRNTS